MKSRMARLALFALVVGFGQSAYAQEHNTSWYCQPEGDLRALHWVDSQLGAQKVAVAMSDAAGVSSDLVVFLHGDAPFAPPVYQYKIAEAVAAQRPNTIAAGVLRPGYEDRCVHKSAGDTGHKMGDNYTAEVVDSVAVVVEALQGKYQPARTIVIGHSGGAALTALLSSRYAHLVDISILVACPCDLPKWRRVMKELTGKAFWQTDLPGLSPVAEVAGLDANKKIYLFTGTEDKVTPVFLGAEYAAAALAAGKKADFAEVPKAGHDNILRPPLLKQMLAVLDR